MSPAMHAAYVGLGRGWREFRQTATSLSDMWFTLFVAVTVLVVLVFQRDHSVEGASVSLALLTLPGAVGMMIGFGGLTGAAGTIAVEREDGTLLRAKAVPHGTVGYLAGRVVSVSLTAVLSVLLVLVPGLFLFPELVATSGTRWALLADMLVLGLLATIPIGAVLGAVAPSPNTLMGIVTLPAMIVIAISGIFYPITALPQWLQVLAQAFPFYWLGLGTRSALLPDAAAAAEIDGSWRPLQTVGVLALWTVVGLALAPRVLRRMARRETGSAVEKRRVRATQRVD